MPVPRRYRPSLWLVGAQAALPLACTGVGRCPGPGNSSQLEEPRGGGWIAERPESERLGAHPPCQFPRDLSPVGVRGVDSMPGT